MTRTVDHPFYLLAFSQKTVRMFECNMHDCEEVERFREIGRVPEGIVEFMAPAGLQEGYEPKGPHWRAPSSTGLLHDDSKVRIEEYIRSIADGAARFLKGVKIPLIVAAVRYEAARFRHLCDYPYLLDDTIDGSPDHATGRELHFLALPLMKEEIRRANFER